MAQGGPTLSELRHNGGVKRAWGLWGQIWTWMQQSGAPFETGGFGGLGALSPRPGSSLLHRVPHGFWQGIRTQVL